MRWHDYLQVSLDLVIQIIDFQKTVDKFVEMTYNIRISANMLSSYFVRGAKI